MNRITLFLFLVSALGFGQTEKNKSKVVADQFEELYNAEDYQKIFELFDENMKANLPLQNTINFLGGLKTQAGKILSREFNGYERGTFASYKTTFESGLFSLNISVDDNNKINGLYIKPFTESISQNLDRNKSDLILPFKGEWFVFWGGDTKEENYHVENKAQKGAFDFVIKDKEGKTYKNKGNQNKDYYAFGKEIISPCKAKVVQVVDGIHDNVPGEMNPVYVPGNTVILKTENNEYLFFAHFKKHSIVVEEGQDIKQGDLLGLCGNSGNSSEPHLHFHIQDQQYMYKATGMKSFFTDILVNEESKKENSPVKGDFVKNQSD